MAKKTPIEKLDLEIKKILKEYEDDVAGNITAVTKAVAQKGAQALRSESRDKFGTVPGQKRKYAKSWAVDVEEKRLTTVATIYNKKGGLPHLLEFGHALRGGGREGDDVKGRAHIKPVEEKLVEEFEKKVEGILV